VLLLLLLPLFVLRFFARAAGGTVQLMVVLFLLLPACLVC
jgi:hypothetical protein